MVDILKVYPPKVLINKYIWISVNYFWSFLDNGYNDFRDFFEGFRGLIQ